MTLSSSTWTFALLLLCVGAGSAPAQGRGGPGGGGGMGMPGGREGSMGMPRGGMPVSGMGGIPTFPHATPPPASNGSPSSSMRGGLQLGPPGRWWDDKKFAKSLGLNSDQQKRMDSVFSQNRDALLTHLDALQKAEGRLEALTHSGKATESALFSEIDRVAQARAELEKANTHMLLQIRDEITAEQLDRLEEHR